MSTTRITGEIELLRGSPATLIYNYDEYTVIVDPGHGSKRVKTISKILEKRNATPENTVILLTHFHTDHVDIIAENPAMAREVIIHELDKPGLVSPLYRITMTFGYPLRSESSMLLFKARPVEPSTLIQDSWEGYGARAVWLPGHTPGHTGYIIDRILYAGDALFGDKVLSRYIAPYHLDACTARESLEKIRGLLLNGTVEWIVPGHGPVVRGEDALKLVEANIKAIDGFSEKIEGILGDAGSRGLTLEEIVSRLPGARETQGVGLLLLAQAGTRGVLACLEAEGRVEARAAGGVVRWVLR